MAGSISPAESGSTALALRRTQLEAQVAAAISRAQKQYIQVQRPSETPLTQGPAHLGSKIDIRV